MKIFLILNIVVIVLSLEEKVTSVKHPNSKQDLQRIGQWRSGNLNKTYFISKNFEGSRQENLNFCESRGMNLVTFSSYAEAVNYLTLIKNLEISPLVDAQYRRSINTYKKNCIKLPWSRKYDEAPVKADQCTQALADGYQYVNNCTTPSRAACEDISEINGETENTKDLKRTFREIKISECKRFYISDDLKLTWDSAMGYCQENGMRLATFASLEESVRFNSKVESRVWVGITDSHKEGHFVKISNGREIQKDDILWNPNEPNNFKNREDCVLAGYLDQNGVRGFNDFDCRQSFRFACEQAINKRI